MTAALAILVLVAIIAGCLSLLWADAEASRPDRDVEEMDAALAYLLEIGEEADRG